MKGTSKSRRRDILISMSAMCLQKAAGLAMAAAGLAMAAAGLSSSTHHVFQHADAFIVRSSSTPPFIARKHTTSSSPQYPTRTTSALSFTTDKEIVDEQLLKQVTKSYLQDLCNQMKLSTKGDKVELLARLRTHADEQAKAERERRQKLKKEIESGVDEEGYPTKHRLVDNDNGFGSSSASSAVADTEEDEGVFYFELPGAKKNNAQSTSQRDPNDDSTVEAARKELDSALAKNDLDIDEDMMIDSETTPITVPPPPPDVKPNEKGERVVTVYSTKDDNDMTSMNTESLMGEPGQEGMAGGYSRTGAGSMTNPEQTLAGGPFGDMSGTQRRKADEKELDDAREVVTELIQGLLAMTGAPGFQDEFMEGLQPLEVGEERLIQRNVMTSSQPQIDFVGFVPSAVPTDMLTMASRSLRAGGGQAFREVLSTFEVQAVGHDGMAADDVSKGGGHYREVRKVGAFLEGYRRAEVRRIARETATMLLDKLVTEGVKGLDLMLATMNKAGDDGAGEAGELNDSLIEYLNEAIRQQEKKVEQLQGNERRTSNRPTEGSIRRGKLEEETAELWKKSVEEGQVVETLDPNDPNVKEAIKVEIERSGTDDGTEASMSLPKTAAEQLLLLLSCLRDRVKAEAAFSTDEKGRNLRVLAYVLHASNDREREEIIINELGSSLDRLDSFLELLTSAIDYTESTSSELSPSSGRGPSPIMLKHIKELVEDINERQAWKASGVSSK